LELFLLRVVQDGLDPRPLRFPSALGRFPPRPGELPQLCSLHVTGPDPGAKLLHLGLVGVPSMDRLLSQLFKLLHLTFIELEPLAQLHDRFHALAPCAGREAPVAPRAALGVGRSRNQRHQCHRHHAATHHPHHRLSPFTDPDVAPGLLVRF
jgi:hypothetical protein